MNSPSALLLLLLAVSFAFATPSFAQAGIPDLSGYTPSLSKAVAAPPKATTTSGVFTSGLTVPTVKPGETARSAGKRVQAILEKDTSPKPGRTQLEAAMPQWLIAIENALGKSGYAKRDIGVAYGFAFLELYKNATGKTVPEDAYRVAFRSLATAITRQWGPKYTSLTPTDKEKVYESLLMNTALNTEFTSQLQAAGKTEDANNFRRASATLFEHLIGVPPAQIAIAPNGTITGLTPHNSKAIKP